MLPIAVVITRIGLMAITAIRPIVISPAIMVMLVTFTAGYGYQAPQPQQTNDQFHGIMSARTAERFHGGTPRTPAIFPKARLRHACAPPRIVPRASVPVRPPCPADPAS